MNAPLAPSAVAARKAGTRAARVLRRTLGALGLVVATLVLTIGPLLYVLARGLGAGGDDFQRGFIGISVVFALCAALGIVGLADWSLSTIARSRATWFLVIALLVAVSWAIVGVDSTRAVKSIPEASLTKPDAIEVSRYVAPAKGGLNMPARASLARSFASDARAEDVEAFYRTELNARGWTYIVTYGSIDGGRDLNWDRDGYTLQLRLDDDIGVGSFTVVILGPVQ